MVNVNALRRGEIYIFLSKVLFSPISDLLTNLIHLNELAANIYLESKNAAETEVTY